jgi:hypothetical protein
MTITDQITSPRCSHQWQPYPRRYRLLPLNQCRFLQTMPSPISTCESKKKQKKVYQISSKDHRFTFLATLCLLLFASSTITLRAIIVRRRLQRQIGGDPLIPAHHHRSRRCRHLVEPKFHDAWVMPGGDSWDSIMVKSTHHIITSSTKKIISFFQPISAQFIVPKPRKTPQPERRRTPSPFCIFRLPNSSADRSPPPPLDTATPPAVEKGKEDQENEKPIARKLQVSVLVAMPVPTPSPTPSDEKIPDVVIGVAHIPYLKPSSTDSQ